MYVSLVTLPDTDKQRKLVSPKDARTKGQTVTRPNIGGTAEHRRRDHQNPESLKRVEDQNFVYNFGVYREVERQIFNETLRDSRSKIRILRGK